MHERLRKRVWWYQGKLMEFPMGHPDGHWQNYESPNPSQRLPNYLCRRDGVNLDGQLSIQIRGRARQRPRVRAVHRKVYLCNGVNGAWGHNNMQQGGGSQAQGDWMPCAVATLQTHAPWSGEEASSDTEQPLYSSPGILIVLRGIRVMEAIDGGASVTKSSTSLKYLLPKYHSAFR